MLISDGGKKTVSDLSPSALIVAVTKGKPRDYTLYGLPEVLNILLSYEAKLNALGQCFVNLDMSSSFIQTK